MWSIFSTRKVRALIAMLIVGMAVVAVVECQWHTASHDQRQASPAGHQRAPSAHTTPDLMCVMATLSMGAALALLFLVTLYAVELVWHPTGFVSPPFIPPEAMLRARSTWQQWTT